MLQYSFDMNIAQQYGVNEAVFVHRLYWWVRDNAANGRNYRDGHYWTYDSLSALTEIFPFWSRRQIEGVINRCREKGLILTAAYNEDRRDRTTWYTVTEVVLQAYEGQENMLQKGGIAFPHLVKCNTPDCEPSFTKRGNVYKEHLEDQLEDERARAHAQDTNSQSKYGEFGNVCLSDEAIGRLLTRWTQAQVRAGIESLSAYMKSKNKRYADHYATLLNWLKKDYPNGKQQIAGRVLVDDD